jgi:hypothetical protein
MNTKGITVGRWFDGVLEDKKNIAQKDNIKAMIFWGHAPNSQRFYGFAFRFFVTALIKTIFNPIIIKIPNLAPMFPSTGR